MAGRKRYECALRSDLLEKAVAELNEPLDNAERLLAIDSLRETYNENKYGKLVRDDDAFLLRFLRAKKFNLEKAAKCLQNYHKIRQDMPDVFTKVKNPVVFKDVMKSAVFYVADGRTKSGEMVVIYRPGLLASNSDIYDVVAYCVFCIEVLLEDEEYQICGHVMVEDFEKFNIGMITKLSPSALKRMNSIWQDCMPVRFKSFHIVNEGTVFDIIFALFKPFMKQKLIKRIKVHGKNYDEIFVDIEKQLAPPYLGGTGPDPESANSEWCTKLASIRGMTDSSL